jgi:hypothetical protein
MAGGAVRRFDTSVLRVRLLGAGRGQPVGPLAASSDGGDIEAEPTAARPVQVLPSPASCIRRSRAFRFCRCPPACSPPAINRRSALQAGWL